MKFLKIILFIAFPISGIAQSHTIEADTLKDVDDGIYTLPSPLQIAYIFKKSGLKYNSKLPHDAKAVNNYASVYSKSIALGIYMSDLAFSVLNKKPAEARNYMQAVVALLNDLGIPSDFDIKDLQKRFDKNIKNEDSIMFILSEMQSKMDDYFFSNDKRLQSCEVFASSFIECLYIAYSDTLNNNKMIWTLADNYSILNSLLLGFEKYHSSDSNIEALVKDLKEIYKMMYEIPGVKEIIDSDGSYEIEIKPSNAQIKNLYTKISELRKKMITG